MPSFISKIESFFTLKGIVLFRLFFGYYYKLSDSPIICILTKLYCIICCGYSALYVFVLASKKNSSILYDGWLVLEIAVNVFISLSKKDEFALIPAERLSTLQLKQHVRATYSMIFISTFYSFYPVWTTWDIVSPFNDIRLTLILQSCYTARLAMVYSGENFAKKIRDLCNSVKDKLEKLDTTDDEKRCHVQEFLDSYVTVMNYAAERNKIVRMKVV
ncbi:hypothetical protein B5X24_HaOG207795 [Helicoverpa armigera]|nr:hypothetical protein B5X24_HaOG207795 [Helicoverpa armigera]